MAGRPDSWEGCQSVDESGREDMQQDRGKDRVGSHDSSWAWPGLGQGVNNGLGNPVGRGSVASDAENVTLREVHDRPIRPARPGRLAWTSERTASPRRQIGVSITPGSSSVTRICAGCSSDRRASLNPTRACFDAAYGPNNGPTTRPSRDPIMRIRAVPYTVVPARSAGNNAWVTRSWPVRLTSS